MALSLPPRHPGAWAAAPGAATRGERHYLYVARAPKDRDGFRTLAPSLEVHDIDDNHRLVKVIPLPPSVFAIRGLCASAATNRLYVAHYGQFKGHAEDTGYSAMGGGRLLCLDLTTNQPLWERTYPPSADRLAITPDGAKIYFPAGEEVKDTFWTVIDARTGATLKKVAAHGKPHNTICSLDGRYAFLQAFGLESQPLKKSGGKVPMPDQSPADSLRHQNGFLTDEMRSLAVVDTKTDTVVRRIGPFQEKTRPFTINGAATLAFMTVNDFLGFQVGDVRTGKVLFTCSVPDRYPQPDPQNNAVWSHGIAMTPDEKEIWVVDQKNIGLHVFEASGLPAKAPVWKWFIKTRTGSPDIYGQPGWIMASIDGRYFYPETGEIVAVRAHKVIGQLTGADKKPTHSRFALEVDFDAKGNPLRVGDQFAVGRRTAGMATKISKTLSKKQ